MKPFLKKLNVAVLTAVSGCLLTTCGQLAQCATHHSDKSDVAKQGAVMSGKTKAPEKQKCAADGKAPLVESFLLQGRLTEGESALLTHLAHNPTDNHARFGLGVMQFLQTVEHLAQDLHRYGFRDYAKTGMLGPITRMPILENSKAEPISYEQLHTVVEDFRQGLMKAELTMSTINDANVKLPIHFKVIKLDLNGDGIYGEDERLWIVYAAITGAIESDETEASKFVVCFDRGDVHWLRGYCHLLSSLAEIYLAYDTRETFDHCAHLLFEKADTPFKYIKGSKHFRKFGQSDVDWLDLIAMIHSLKAPIKEPLRMEAALHHLENVVTQSHESWKWIMAETDDDHEWLPNPKQTGVIPNVRVTEEMVETWNKIMVENGKILSGELLIPFWRGNGNVGINLRKVFLQPTVFDAVYWAQGTSLEPYLERGKLTDGRNWSQWRNAFGHNVPGFAVWFN